jgi:hypothetical protein
LTPQKKNSEIDGAFPIKNKKKIEVRLKNYELEIKIN